MLRRFFSTTKDAKSEPLLLREVKSDYSSLPAIDFSLTSVSERDIAPLLTKNTWNTVLSYFYASDLEKMAVVSEKITADFIGNEAVVRELAQTALADSLAKTIQDIEIEAKGHAEKLKKSNDNKNWLR